MCCVLVVSESEEPHRSVLLNGFVIGVDEEAVAAFMGVGLDDAGAFVGTVDDVLALTEAAARFMAARAAFCRGADVAGAGDDRLGVDTRVVRR